ncbi:MAG TPA: glycosyltransferase family 4 protein [Chloroflexota bacterium]
MAHVVATFPPYWAGTGNVAYHNALELARRGHEVTVLTGDVPLGDYRDPPELEVRRLPTPLRIGNAPLTPALLSELTRYDLVHLHWPFIFGAELTWLTCRLSGQPYVVTYHHDLRADLRWQFGPYQAAIGPLVLRGAARVLPVSLDHFRASPMHRWLAGRPDRIAEQPNGVDVTRFRPDVDGGAIRARHGIAADAFVVGYLGAMDSAHPFKGVPVLLEAFACLERPGAVLLAVGGGDLQPRYRAEAERLGLADRVRWTGIAPADELAAHVAAMDAFVFPSLGFGAESFGVVLIEAMASGKPVVATSIPGPRAVVDDGVDGFVVPPGDAAALAARIADLADGPALRAGMGAAGRRKVEQRYAWPHLAERLETHYRSILPTACSRGRLRPPG